MSRLESGGTHDPEKWRADVRIADDDLAERAEAVREEKGMSKSELVRAALDEYLPDEKPDGPRIRPPESQDLRDALRELQRLAEPNDGHVPADVAQSELAQDTGRSKKAVVQTLIQPLINQGYVKTQGGQRSRSTYRVILPKDVHSVIEHHGLDVEEDAADVEGGSA